MHGRPGCPTSDEKWQNAAVKWADAGHRRLSIRIELDPPYPFRPPEPELTDDGIEDLEYFTTGQVCRILELHPDTFRYRLRAGIYSQSSEAIR